MMEMCKGTTKAGHPCRQVHGLYEDGRCIQHSNAPGAAESREASRESKTARGQGRKRAEKDKSTSPPAPETIDDAIGFYRWLTWAVVNGHITSDRANSARASLDKFVQAKGWERAIKDLAKRAAS
jgi:hypothetical protein